MCGSRNIAPAARLTADFVTSQEGPTAPAGGADDELKAPTGAARGGARDKVGHAHGSTQRPESLMRLPFMYRTMALRQRAQIPKRGSDARAEAARSDADGNRSQA